MMKTLVVAATFAASTMIVGVPSASASPLICMQTLQIELDACDGDTECELDADMNFINCLDSLYQEHQ